MLFEINISFSIGGINFQKISMVIKKVIKNNLMALAAVAQWIEHGPANQRVAGSIPSQSTCLGCGPGPC